MGVANVDGQERGESELGESREWLEWFSSEWTLSLANLSASASPSSVSSLPGGPGVRGTALPRNKDFISLPFIMLETFNSEKTGFHKTAGEG
jgi:hypothetical protein